MKKLMNKEIRITSVELVEVINEFRKLESDTTGKKYTELLHKDFMKKIRTELETLKTLGLGGERNISPSSYINSQNKEQPCYSLNRDGMLEMLNSESALVRYKTIEYINKLEEENKTLKDEKANLLLAIYNGGQEGIAAAKKLTELEVEEATKPLLPKAEFYDKVLNPTDEENGFTKLLTTTEVAKDLGMTARQLNNILHEKRIIYKKGKTWVLYSKYDHLISEKYCDYFINEFGNLLKWTEKGRKFIIELLEK